MPDEFHSIVEKESAVSSLQLLTCVGATQGWRKTINIYFFNASRTRRQITLFLDTSSHMTELLQRSLRLELIADGPFLLPSAAVLTTGLELIRENRKLKKATAAFDMCLELELAATIRRQSWSRQIRESADIMQNMITIFFG